MINSEPPSGWRRKAIALIDANSKRQAHDYEGALRHYFAVRDLLGGNAAVSAAIANCYFVIALGDPDETGKNYQEAVDWMRKAVNQAPHDGRLHAILAQYYWVGILDYREAVQEFHRAIVLNPDDIWALSQAASLYGVPDAGVGRDEAIGWLEHAVFLEPDEPTYHVRLAQLYHEANRISDAEREWSRSLLCPRPLDEGSVEVIKGFLMERPL